MPGAENGIAHDLPIACLFIARIGRSFGPVNDGGGAMGRLLRLLLTAPFWVHLLLAGGLAYWTHTVLAQKEAFDLALTQLAKAEPPAEVPITAYQPPPSLDLPVEVNLRAQIAVNHNTQVRRAIYGVPISDQTMYVLVAPDAPPDTASATTQAYGAIVLRPDQQTDFATWVRQAMQREEMGPVGPVLAISGLLTTPSNIPHLEKSLADLGLRQTEGFVYIAPFLHGRAAALSAPPAQQKAPSLVAFWPSLLFAAIGLVRLVSGQIVTALRPGAGGAAKSCVPEPRLHAAPPTASASRPAGDVRRIRLPHLVALVGLCLILFAVGNMMPAPDLSVLRNPFPPVAGGNAADQKPKAVVNAKSPANDQSAAGRMVKVPRVKVTRPAAAIDGATKTVLPDTAFATAPASEDGADQPALPQTAVQTAVQMAKPLPSADLPASSASLPWTPVAAVAQLRDRAVTMPPSLRWVLVALLGLVPVTLMMRIGLGRVRGRRADPFKRLLQQRQAEMTRPAQS